MATNFIEKLKKDRLEEAKQEYEDAQVRCSANIRDWEARREQIRNDASIPETTDTISKLNAANGKKIILWTPMGESDWRNAEASTLDFSGGRVNTDGVSYPLIGEPGHGVAKIVDAETNEVIFENKYIRENIAYQTAMLLGRESGIEEANAQIESQKRSIDYWKRSYDELSKAFDKGPEWVERGAKFIYPQRRELWEECVYRRASDLYHGMDLDNALQIMEALDNGATVEEAGKLIDDGHSGMSYGVTMSIVLTFSKRGVEFCKANHSSYRYAVEHNDAESVAKWEAKFAEVEAENKAYEKAGKPADGKGGQGGKK